MTVTGGTAAGPGVGHRSEDGPTQEILHGAVRGAVGAMAMTGARRLTASLGLLEEAPPDAIFRQRARGLLRLVPRRRRRAVIELSHWGGRSPSIIATSIDEAMTERRPRWQRGRGPGGS